MIFLDFETTGTDIKTDRIVQLCMIKVFDKGERIVKSTLVNPTIPIPKAASDVHGISDEQVKDAPEFKKIAKGVHEFIKGCNLAGFNSNSFDIPLLYCELNRAGITWDYSTSNFIDVRSIFTRKEERTLSAAVKFYLDKDHTDAHDAIADVQATIDVFKAQMLKYEDLPHTAAELSTYCNFDKSRCDISGCFAKDDKGDYVLNFGKHKGKRAADVKDYLKWMLSSDFLPDAKAIASSQI